MLRLRILTAVIALVGLFVVLFVVPATVARAVIAALILAGAWEWGGLIFYGRGRETLGRIAFVAFVATLIAAIYIYLAEAGFVSMLFKGALIWWSAALVWMFFFPTPIPLPIVWLSGAFVLLPAWTALDYLYLQDPQQLLFALLIVWVADIGAYFAGKSFGRVKLAPKVSPGKSWEGVLGGLLAVLLLAVAGNNYFSTEIAVLVPLCMAVALISVIGDLTVSMFKRNAGVKDSGTLFPGHGGVLDRIDSVSAATPLFALASSWVGLASL